MSAARSQVVGVLLGMVLAVRIGQAQEHVHTEPSPPEVQDHSQHQLPEQQAGQAVPALTDADRAAAFPVVHAHPMPDNAIHGFALLDRLEAWDADEGAALAWEGHGWIGTDLDRLWLRSEGERIAGSVEAAHLEALYGRSIAVWWDVVAGVRHEFRPAEPRTFAALGIQGLAPQRFEISATAYLGEHGHSAAHLTVEYELLLTNRLILRPLLELELNGKDDASRGIGSGLGHGEAGLRLRYEVTRRFAPYLGLVHARSFGRTADLLRSTSLPVHDTRGVIGLRLWF
ncbi:MAG TPA: copper resistance protein B [Steroidobacteraceae bacterium]|nr:copper resistance protein B [Steroidobacteraceae bacterium]